jgi:lipoprotein-releasing system permease protein
MKSTFQYLVALRYLKRREPLSWGYHWLTGVIGVCLALAFALSFYVNHDTSRWASDFRADYGGILDKVKLGLLVSFVLIQVYLLVSRWLTLFTSISVYGLFLGSGALVIVLSVMSGFEHDLRRKIMGQSAHVVISTGERSFVGYEDVRKKVAALPNVIGASPYITNEVMISSQSNLSGVVLKGIDPATVGQVTDLVKNTDPGGLDYLEHPEKLRTLGGPPEIDHVDDEAPLKPPTEEVERRVVPGVIIGRELAKNLRLYLGDDVNIVSPLGGIGPSGPIPKSKPFRIAGIFFSGMFEYDSKYVYMTIPSAQKFLSQEEEVTGIELKIKDPDQTEPVMAAIRKAIGEGYEVRDWKEINRNLFSALKLEKILMFIVLMFIVMVAAFSIIANGIMLVMERKKEISILKAMGASDGATLNVFVILGVYVGLLGTLSGIIVGVLACIGLKRFGLPLDPDVYYITQLPVQMNPNEILAVLVAGLVIAVTFTLYPAWAAARVRPVEGLH